MLSSTGFDSWTIYSRIYLPMIFPVDKYIYLDNDIVINGDIAELFAQKLEPKSFRDLLPKSKQTAEPYRSKNSPVVGFVFETNQMYRGYIHSHFNVSHPLVRKVLQHNHPEIFFNAGVALVNADQWRKEGLTKKAETLLFENTLHHGLLFDSKAVGDQGLFYLLLDGRMTYLPHKFNMRRLPNKTVRFLDQNELGIIHFAGTTHGNAHILCENPLHYPHLSTGAVPLFLSVISSLHAKCPMAHQFIPSSCFHAIQSVQYAVINGNLTVKYNPGRGNFRWPPIDYKNCSTLSDNCTFFPNQ